MQAIQTMSALAQPTRMELFAQLARAAPDGMTAGALAERVGIPPNLMSGHMAILSRAGLVASVRTGRNVIYSVVPAAIGGLVRFLTEDCCPGCVVDDRSQRSA